MEVENQNNTKGNQSEVKDTNSAEQQNNSAGTNSAQTSTTTAATTATATVATKTNNNNNNIPIRKYFNNNFPHGNKELFDSEKEELTKIYEEMIVQIYKERDIKNVNTNLSKKRQKLQLLYGISSSVKQRLSEILLHMTVEEQYLKLDAQLLTHSLNTHSTLHWQPLWNAFLNTLFQNNISNTHLSEVTLPEAINFLWAIKRLRHRFSDESISQVYDLYKKLKLSNNGGLALVLIRYFLKISRKTDKQYYTQIFNELTMSLNYDQTSGNKLVIITLIYNLAITHPELDWQNHYEQIFTYFSRYYLQRMPLGFTYVQPQQKTYYLSLHSPQALIQSLLINLICPASETEKHNKIWQNIHRFFNLIKQYLHPNYENTPTIKFLFLQFQQFVSNYIWSHADQQKTINHLTKSKDKLNRKIKFLASIQSNDNANPNNSNNINGLDEQSQIELELQDQQIDNELLNEENEGHMQMDKAMDAMKSQANDYENNDASNNNNGQSQKIEDEDEEDDDDDDEDDEDEIDEFDEKYKNEFIQKTQAQQNEIIQKYNNKLANIASKLEIKKRFAFDQACHDQFEQIIESNLINILGLNDQNRNILTQICKDLCYFNPNKFIPIILDTIYEAFDKPDMNYSSTISVLTAIIIPMVDRNNYKKGLYEIPKLMKKVLDIFNTSNFQLSVKMWKLFDQIFQIIPIYNIDDLQEQYMARNPNKTYSEFYADLNKDEEINMVNFYEQLHEVTYNAFQKFLSIFEHIDMPRSKNTRGFRAAVMSVLNFFSSIAFSSSNRLFKQLWNHAFSCISDRQQLHASKFYSYLIHSFALRDPEQVLSRMIPYLFNQILSKREKNSDLTELQKQPLYYLIEQQPNKDLILSYQIETINSNSLFWYLNLLEDSIFFARHTILQYKSEIETIIFLCFVHPETELSKKACQLLQKLFHSMTTFYPQEMNIWSENEIENDVNFKEMYHRYIGQNAKKKFSMQWHEPTQGEIEYSKDLFFRVYSPILNHFNAIHFADLQPLDVMNSFPSILDKTLHAPDDAPRALKIELQRSIMILFHLYSSIATRLKWGVDEQDKIYERFSSTFCLEEYNNVNNEMIDFTEKMINFLIKNNLFYDSNVAQVYLSLILFILGNDDQTSYINGIKNKLRELKNFNSNPYRSYQGYPRFIEVTSITTQFNTKIILYTFDVKLNQKHSKLLHPLLFLIMHPYQKISEKSISSFQMMGDMLNCKDAYNATLKVLCNFLSVKLNKKSNEFLPRMIEESKERDGKEVPLLSTYLERVIASQTILNYAINKFAPDQHAFIIDSLMSIIESYNVFLSKDTKDKIIDIPLNQLLHLVTKLKKYSLAYTQPIQPLGIYQEKSAVLKKIQESIDCSDRLYKMQDENKEIIDNLLNEIYCRCVRNLEDASVFSKEKSFMLILAMKTADMNEIKSERFNKVLEHALNFINFDNLHSRNVGRAVLFKCMRAIKAYYKTRTNKNILTDDYILNQNKTIAELSAYFLYQPQDIQDGYTSNRAQDFMLYKKTSTYSQHKNENKLYERMQDDEFFNNFLQHLLNDITAHSIAEPTIKPKNIFNSSDLIFQQEFIKNFKKRNFLNDGAQFFHLKFCKKIFSLVGMKYFNAARENIEKHRNDTQTFESQLIMNILTFSSLLGIFSNELDASKEEKEDAYKYLIELIKERMYSLTLEQFAYFMKYIECICESVSFQDAQRIFNDICSDSKLNNNQDNKYSRLLYTKLISLSKFNLDNQNILNSLINELSTVNPLSIQQLAIYSHVHNAIWSYHQISIDFNFCKKYNILKDIDAMFESGQLKKIDEFQSVKVNNDIKKIYDFIVSQLNSDDNEIKKKYFRLTKSFSQIFKEDHLFKTEIFNSMRNLFPYLIEFKEEDISDAQLVQELWANLIYLTIPLYKKETIIEIFQLCYTNFKNTNWRIRQRALLFSQFIAFFNLYRIGDENYIDPILIMMNDEQKQNKSIAQKVLSSMIKTLPVEQVGGFVKKMQEMAVSDDKNTKVTAVYCLMSVLLSYPHDIKPWTEQAIRTILKNKNISHDTLTLLKEFGAAFLRNTFHNKVETKLKLPEDLIIRLEEISRPHNYFA